MPAQPVPARRPLAGMPPTEPDPAQGTPDCPDGRVCVWTRAQYDGTRTVKRTPGYKCHHVPENVVRSARNRTDLTIWLYRDGRCGTLAHTLTPGARNSDTGDIHSWRAKRP